VTSFDAGKVFSRSYRASLPLTGKEETDRKEILRKVGPVSK
jgi:hypothetical protein